MARHVFVSVVFILLYLFLSHPQVILFSRLGFVAWYPATGLVIAMLLGVSPWYAVIACVSDALASSIFYHQPVASYGSTFGAVGIAGCYGMAAAALRGSLHIDVKLHRRRDVVLYILLLGIAATGATIIGVACLVADHGITWGEYRSAALTWFLGDAIGLVAIAPFLLIHVLPYVRHWLVPVPTPLHSSETEPSGTALTWGSLAETCAQLLAIMLLIWVMFGRGDGHYDYFYVCFIPIIWIAMRQGIRRVVSAVLVLDFGIVATMHFLPPTPGLFVRIALLMLVVSSVGLLVGSEVSERHRLAMDLNQQTMYLDSLIQNTPLGIVVLDRGKRVELTNLACEKLFQYERDELASVILSNMETASRETTDSTQLIAEVFAGKTLHKTVQQRRKDGRILDLAAHGVPLVSNGEVRGAYLIYEDISEQIRAAESQRQHAESLSRLVKELELRSNQMTALNEMGALLECCGSVHEARTVIADSIRKLFPDVPSGGLYLFKASRNLLEAVLRWGTVGSVSEKTFSPDTCWSLRRGQPHWSGRGVSCPHLAQNSSSECLCVPMVAQGNTVGILHLQFDMLAEVRDIEYIRSSNQTLAVNVASQVALSLAGLKLRESLREQSIRDPLTGLFNRRFLEESLGRELKLASRKKQGLAVLFLDLDHFKRFNDTFGHAAGDIVLQSLADLLRASFRTTDLCCRYGGEEFAIVLPESGLRDAHTRADTLRSKVKNLRVQFKNQILGPLTVSVGLAAFPEHGSTSEDLLRIADRCLYESKSRGRDVVTAPVTQNAQSTSAGSGN